MMIDTRAREASRRAHLEVAAIEVPYPEMVLDRRRAWHRARLARATAVAAVLVAVAAGVTTFTAREARNAPGGIRSTATPTRPGPSGLAFESLHTHSCNTDLFQAVFGCVLVRDSGTSNDVASVAVRDAGRTGWVIDLTLTPAARKRFVKDVTFSASVDGVQVNAARAKTGTLTLTAAEVNPWDATRANALAARILATR